jgi:hypothetical protein
VTPSIEVGSLVIAHCMGPKEKVWGVVLRLDQVGVVLRGLDLNSVEDWLRQQCGGETTIGPSTQFIPMHRLERLYLDESSGMIESIASRYAAACGGDARSVLLGETPEGGGSELM